MKPYGLASDLHCHNWQAFSSVGEDGINTRLKMLLMEVGRLAAEVVAADGDTLYFAGDIFHVRGSIAPSVLNPVLDLFRSLIAQGLRIVIIPGNHDLESKHSKRVSNAVTALESVGCLVCHETQVFDDEPGHSVLVVPWHDKVADLKAHLLKLEAYAVSDTDLILHAPIDGTIKGLPDHGLDPEWLGNLGFRSVYAGHYHHHKEFDHNVFSIGAVAHHTWSDVGSKAGFLVVGSTGPKWFKSHTPEFVDLSAATDEAEVEIMAEGNYVRARVTTSKVKEINELREWLMKSGAKGVVIQTIKEPTKAREGSIAHSVKAGASIETSIADYVKSQEFPNGEQVQMECQRILAEVEAE